MNIYRNKKQKRIKVLSSMKHEKGITLIALVITIIVLLILAGVSISIILGDNGLLERAKNTSEYYSKEQDNEENQLNEVTNFINKYITGNSEEMITADMVSFVPEDSNWNVENVKEALDYLYNNLSM